MVADHAVDVAADEDARSPFDALAEGYDGAFTDSSLGRELRRAVWQNLDGLPLAGRRWLDLGCGTGEDALWLCRRGATVVGVDASVAMLAVAATKARQAGVDATRLHLARADLNQPESLPAACGPGDFDGALANFGVLNCVADLPRLVAVLDRLLAPSAPLLAITMGPFCAWEVAGGLLGGRVGRAARRWRLRRFATASGQTPLRYPSPAALARDLAPCFIAAQRPLALGLLLPPTDIAAFLRRRPVALKLLGQVEGLVRGLPGAAWLSDHYVTRFHRTPSAATLSGP